MTHRTKTKVTWKWADGTTSSVGMPQAMLGEFIQLLYADIRVFDILVGGEKYAKWVDVHGGQRIPAAEVERLTADIAEELVRLDEGQVVDFSNGAQVTYCGGQYEVTLPGDDIADMPHIVHGSYEVFSMVIESFRRLDSWPWNCTTLRQIDNAKTQVTPR